MKSNRVPFLFLIIILLTSCGSTGGGSSTPSPTLVSIAVTPSNPSIALGLTEQFIARGTFSNSSNKDITASVTWSSSNTAVATISNAGLVSSSSKSTGTATITATSGNITSNSITLTVTAPALVSIEVTPADLSIPMGTTQQFTATGTYSDSSTQDLTISATWSSSTTDAATISGSGLVTAAAAGMTIIMAKSGSVSAATTLTVTGGTPAVAVNVMPITVNGSLCNANTSSGYLNKPCVTVKVCTPGTTTCQTIDDILLDTGSYGLRIFSNATPTLLTVSLPTVASGSGFLANCARFGDGSTDWGPVKLADVVLGSDSERAVNVPIQVIDATFGTVPSSCGSPDLNPAAAGFNGILGVGVFPQDCGSKCETGAIGVYYSCNGAVCSPVTVPLSNQVTNPVVSLPTDNNGVIVQLPTAPTSGAPSVNGILVLGIGTSTNNTPPANVTTYNADQFGQIRTILNGKLYGSIVDSGSNGLFFTPPSLVQLPICSSASPWFCPSPSPVTLSATNSGASAGSPGIDVFFQVDNFVSLTSSPTNQVFSNIGGYTSVWFDWGLPFYFGRNIYVGIESLGRAPYFAY